MSTKLLLLLVVLCTYSDSQFITTRRITEDINNCSETTITFSPDRSTIIAAWNELILQTFRSEKKLIN
jgi:hypothetical protein